MGQSGDGSTHHCPLNAPFSTPVQSCPKVKTGCGESNRDGVKFTNEYGVGHFPPFVAFAAVKNAYTDCATSDVCNWFDYDTHGCSIPKSTMDMLVYEYFGVDDRIEFQPPIIINGLSSNTYYRVQYFNEGDACGSSCRGPHCCSEEVAAEDVWGDFCPYFQLERKLDSIAIHILLSLLLNFGWQISACLQNATLSG
jgi:hypothetical protein